MASLGSAPVYPRKRVMRPPTISFTTIEDDPDIAPVLKVSAQLVVPVQTAAGDDKEKQCHTPMGRIMTGLIADLSFFGGYSLSLSFSLILTRG
jgi:hypothetical protein